MRARPGYTDRGATSVMTGVTMFALYRWLDSRSPAAPDVTPEHLHPVIRMEEKTKRSIRFLILEDHHLAAEGLELLAQRVPDWPGAECLALSGHSL
jgi:hypothetical protein